MNITIALRKGTNAAFAGIVDYFSPVMRKVGVVVLCGGLLSGGAAAQTPEQAPPPQEVFALSARGGLLFNMHSAELQSFQNAPDCGVFRTGTGMGFSGLLGIEVPLADGIHGGITVGLMRRNAGFSNQGSFPARDTANNRFVDVETENSLDISPLFLDIYPEVRYTLVENLVNGPLRAIVGGRIGVSFGGTYSQKEEIKAPDNAAFRTPDGRRVRERLLAEGDLADMSVPFGVMIGLENALRIGENLQFTQQIAYEQGFSNLAANTNWKAGGFRVELGLRYAFMSNEKVPLPEPEPLPELEPEVIAPPAPIVNLEMRLSKPLELVRYISFPDYAARPFIGTIFFDSASSAVPSRYNVSSVEGPIGEIKDPGLIHVNIIRILAELMHEAPLATITLTGATSGEGDEEGGLALAQARADAVKNTLVRLGVSSDRISVEANVTPASPSNARYREGRIENRRVDFKFSGQEMPSKEQATDYFVKGEATIELQTQHIPQGEQVTLASSLLPEEKAVGGDTVLTIPFRLPILNLAKTFTIAADAGIGTINDQKSFAYDLVQLSPIDSGYVPQKYNPSLAKMLEEPFILFDYDEFALLEINRKLLDAFVEKVPAGSTILIEGSTDILGSKARNEFLAKKRVESVSEYLATQAKALGKELSFESETKSYLERNDLPEERLLNRSVQVRLKR